MRRRRDGHWPGELHAAAHGPPGCALAADGGGRGGRAGRGGRRRGGNCRPGALPRTRVGRRHPRPQDHRDHPHDAAVGAGLGYPASTPVLGSRQVRMAGRDAVILVLAADAPRELTAVAVPGTCSAADTGLLADTTVRRP